MNGTLTRVVRQLADSWQVLVAVLVMAGFLLTGWAKITTVAQIPEKVDSLKVAHDTQTAIMRKQELLEGCQIVLTAPKDLQALLPRDSRRRCVALAAKELQ